MVCDTKCCCGSFCRRLLCRTRQNEQSDEPELTLTQLAEAKIVKFTEKLKSSLSIGSHIVCTGTPSEDLPWFTINIGCGDVESSYDIPVHFNVRVPQCYVVRNTMKSGRWGVEETTSFRSFPFKMHRPFTIEILLDETETLFAVDGHHYCSYTHRQPSVFAAKWVQVSGIRDATLNVQKIDNYPTLAPRCKEVPYRPYVSAPFEDIEPIWHPNVIGLLPRGVPEGHQVVVHARLRPLLHSFSIDLMDEVHDWPRPNIHIHVNLRAYVDSQMDRQLVVLNAWFGAWGDERRQRTARLIPGTWTTFRIALGPSEWSVFADDILIGELDRRASPRSVKAVRIRGDLYPQQIYMCPFSTSPVKEHA